MIPRHVHQLWIGPKDIPSREREWCAQMARMNPTWKHTLHRNELLTRYVKDPFVLHLHREATNNPKNWAFVADRLRVLLLRDEGGVYLDVDCEPVQPLDLIFSHIPPTTDFVAALRSPHRKSVTLHRGVPLVDNTFMASAKGGRLINRLAALWSTASPVVNGHDTGVGILDNADPHTVLLGHRYIYAEQRYPETVVLHDAHNLGSWTTPLTLPLTTSHATQPN